MRQTELLKSNETIKICCEIEKKSKKMLENNTYKFFPCNSSYPKFELLN